MTMCVVRRLHVICVWCSVDVRDDNMCGLLYSNLEGDTQLADCWAEDQDDPRD